jgi:GxxExxY protein
MISKDVGTGSNAEVGVPLEFEGVLIEVGYRIDMRIDQLVLVENKTVEKILPIHLAQLLTSSG